MVRLHWYSDIFEGEKATWIGNVVTLYDDENLPIVHITDIGQQDIPNIHLEGEWSDPADIPTEEEKLRADLDFETMCSEAMQADVDYCLMMLGE